MRVVLGVLAATSLVLLPGCYTRMNETLRRQRVASRAAFDLNCADVDIQVIAVNNYGALGCGQRAVYALHDCGDGWVESACTVVLDGPGPQANAD